MSQELPAPVPRLTVITLGVNDMRASIAFYEALGFARELRGDRRGRCVLRHRRSGARRCFPGISSRQTPRCRTIRGHDVSRHDAGLELRARARRSMRCWISPSPRERRC